MASIKVFLWKKADKHGKYPLTIRVTKDRKSSYIYIGHSIDMNEWDTENHRVRKSHPSARKLNTLIQKKLFEANEKLLDLEIKYDDVSTRAIKNNLKSLESASFFAQANIYLENKRKSRKYNQVVSDEPRIKHFREFLKGEDIVFQDITVPLLKKYQAYLKGTRGISERTVVNHLMVIRTIFNQAKTANLVDAKHYPFGKNKIPIKFPQSVKIGLTPEDVKKLEKVSLPDGSFQDHARNVWLFSFYFAGMRVSDVLRLKWSDFQNDRLYYSMGKNEKAGSLSLSDKTVTILDKYKRDKPKHDLVFPELEVLESLDDAYEVQRKISYAVKQLDKYLKEVATEAKIPQKLTMHIARHTFGNISGDKIPIQMLQKLYRHSSITTTIAYQANFIHKDADDALKAVINI